MNCVLGIVGIVGAVAGVGGGILCVFRSDFGCCVFFVYIGFWVV